jgi:hypothetical protein
LILPAREIPQATFNRVVIAGNREGDIYTRIGPSGILKAWQECTNRVVRVDGRKQEEKHPKVEILHKDLDRHGAIWTVRVRVRWQSG